MAINPMKLLQLKSAWETFKGNHTKLFPFLKAAQPELREGSVIEISVVSPEGKRLETNLRLNASDMELFQQIVETVGTERP